MLPATSAVGCCCRCFCFMLPQGTFNLKRQQIVERSAQAVNLTPPLTRDPPFTLLTRPWTRPLIAQRQQVVRHLLRFIALCVPHSRRALELTCKEKKVRKACISTYCYIYYINV